MSQEESISHRDRLAAVVLVELSREPYKQDPRFRPTDPQTILAIRVNQAYKMADFMIASQRAPEEDYE